MEEILQELIKTTLEKGPQNKQFYSNLSITKPIHDHVENQSRLRDAIKYLESCFKTEEGFQSKLYTSKNCAIQSSSVCDSFKSGAKEILTAVLALDLLFSNNSTEDELISPELQRIITLPHEIQDALQDFVVPSLGLSTFNLFKQDSSPSASPGLPNNANDEEPDSGNDSPTSMYTDNNELMQFTAEHFPDDINTTVLTLSVLLEQGILQAKPAESVVRWLISNAFIFEEAEVQGEYDEGDEKHDKITLITFPTFTTGQGSSDAVAVANFYSLMNSLNISHEAVLKNCESFLATTLRNTIAEVESSTTRLLLLPPTKRGEEMLGNTSSVISSDANEQEMHIPSRTNEKEEEASVSVQPFIQHHSPDSLLYFLSRSLAITVKGRRRSSNSNHLKSLLFELLDARLGTSVDTCDLAMRILAAVYLGVLLSNKKSSSSSKCHFSRNHPHLLLRMKNLVRKEYELLVSLQQVDGSWPPDSIVKIGYLASGVDDDGGDGDEDNNRDAVGKDGEVSAFLGGKELATLFAVKAVSAYLSQSKGDLADLADDEDDSEEEDGSVEDHYLY